MTLLVIDVDMSDEQLIGESVCCDLSKCYGVVIGTSAVYFGGQAHDSWPRNLAPWYFFNGFQQAVQMYAGKVL